MNSLRSYLLLFVFFLAFCTKKEEEDSSQLIAELLNERIEEYKLSQSQECQEDAILSAEIYVDSILHDVLNIELLDSVEMIEKPSRPFRPDYIRDVDTSSIQPLFERSIQHINEGN